MKLSWCSPVPPSHTLRVMKTSWSSWLSVGLKNFATMILASLGSFCAKLLSTMVMRLNKVRARNKKITDNNGPRLWYIYIYLYDDENMKCVFWPHLTATFFCQAQGFLGPARLFFFGVPAYVRNQERSKRWLMKNGKKQIIDTFEMGFKKNCLIEMGLKKQTFVW